MQAELEAQAAPPMPEESSATTAFWESLFQLQTIQAQSPPRVAPEATEALEDKAVLAEAPQEPSEE